MIINHQHRFCFFAIPRTASTAISTVLIEQYKSNQLFRKHCTYSEFIRKATDDELRYFRFTAIRNPIDSVVSAYFKKRSDHNGRFTNRRNPNGRPLNKAQLQEYQFITSTNATFQEYFNKFHTQPYRRPRHEHTVRHMDSIIRFESLNKDFEKVMNRLNLPIIPIPKVNATSKWNRDFLDFYTPDIIPQAIKVFSPLMKDWGYALPEEWAGYYSK